MAHRVTVYDNRISGLIRTGEGNRWIRGKADEIKDLAVIMAPKRSGRLAASHEVAQAHDRGGLFVSNYAVSARTPYAAFVHGGTGLYGPHRKVIVYRKPAGPIPTERGNIYIWSQKGQRAQPWLARAASIVVARSQ